ncbi:MAG: glycosyltransferase [Thermoproteota archaeon]
MVTTSFPRWVDDGQGSFIWEAARAISQQGVRVRVVAMHSPGARTYECIEDIEILRPRYWWPEKLEILRKEGGGLPVVWKKYPIARLQIFPFIIVHTAATARFARDCDLIHAHWTLSAAAALLGRQIHRRPILVTLQGSDIFQAANVPKGSWITKNILLRCDCITALSNALAEAARSIGVHGRHIHIIPNGVDVNRFIPPIDGYRGNFILYVGSLIERKGVKYLINSMPIVLRFFPSYRLILIGEGPQYRELKQIVENLEIGERVVFLGFQPQEQVRSWLQRAKVLILPSLEEGQGVVLLEAMACGTPVIASQVGGIPEIVTDEVGVLVPPADPIALAEAIVSILSNSHWWNELSSCARERAVKHYSWDLIAKLYITLYESLVT